MNAMGGVSGTNGVIGLGDVRGAERKEVTEGKEALDSKEVERDYESAAKNKHADDLSCESTVDLERNDGQRVDNNHCAADEKKRLGECGTLRYGTQYHRMRHRNRSRQRRWGGWLRAIPVTFVAMLAVCAMLCVVMFAVAPRAEASSRVIVPTPGNMRVILRYGQKSQAFGPLGQDEHSYYYCMETRAPLYFKHTTQTFIEHSETASRLAWLMDRYGMNAQFDNFETEKNTRVAIAVLVHDYYDVTPDVWAIDRQLMLEQFPEMVALAEQLWEESGREAPVEARVLRTEVQGLDAGEVEIAVLNAAGEALSGVPYVVTIDGPAVFDNGENEIAGISSAELITHAWRATDLGEVEINVHYDQRSLEQLPSASEQDIVHLHDQVTRSSGKAVTFTVQPNLEIKLRTQTAAKVVDAGDVVVDNVISSSVDGGDADAGDNVDSDNDDKTDSNIDSDVSGANAGDADAGDNVDSESGVGGGVGADGGGRKWPDGMEIEATGWYFDGLTEDQLDEAMTPNEGESAADFLIRLADRGFTPSAYSSAMFTGPNQTVSATAMTEPNGDVAYRAPADGGFGTWVWAFERDRQSEQVRKRLDADVVTGFLDPEETNVNRSRVQVASTVADHVVNVGTGLSDTITVTGFPDDHGSFVGDEIFGFAADEPYAQVSVWWAGDPSDPSNDDQYRPEGEAVPEEDENHRLIGTWDYPASNGVLHVGGGAPDAHGNPVTIVAETHGWYVFVWNFIGDDRVAPASSAYDDPWERVRVRQPEEPSEPQEREEPTPLSLTTQVDPERVQVGELFRDSAHLIGSIPEGAYVTFTAYQAIQEGAAPGFNGTLLDEVRVDVDSTLNDQVVYSPQVSSPNAGLVYWRASLMSADGDVLVSHELGVEGEIVTVEEPEEPSKEEPPLAMTGTDVLVMTALTLAIGVLGVAILLIVRARGRLR